MVDDTIDIEINPRATAASTLTRSSGAGGQHVNTTEFGGAHHAHADRHRRSSRQEERSQHQNREIALSVLKARLYELELKKREEKANAEQAGKTEIGWGHQIRSYVLQPYQLVKDLRTGAQSTNPAAVLDGDIDPFIESGAGAAHQGRRRRSRSRIWISAIAAQAVARHRAIAGRAVLLGHAETHIRRALKSGVALEVLRHADVPLRAAAP